MITKRTTKKKEKIALEEGTFSTREDGLARFAPPSKPPRRAQFTRGARRNPGRLVLGRGGRGDGCRLGSTLGSKRRYQDI